MIGFVQGSGDGVKAGLRIVNRKPEILFELIRFVMERCKIYGDPDKWLSDLISETKIRELIRSGKHAEMLQITNIDNKWARYWLNESIEFAFNFIESSLSTLVRLLARKALHWKQRYLRLLLESKRTLMIEKAVIMILFTLQHMGVKLRKMVIRGDLYPKLIFLKFYLS